MNILKKIFTLVFLTFVTAGLQAGTYEQELSKLTADVDKELADTGVKTIAAVDFKDLQGKVTDLGKFLAEEISVNLAMQDKKISMADRANLKRIMEEHKLTEEGLVNPDNAKKLGQLAGLDAIMFGTVTPFDNSYRLNIKVITTDTGKIVAAARGSFTKTETLDTLAGSKTDSSARADSTGSDNTTTPAPEPPKKQKVYDLGMASVEIKSVDYISRSRKVRVSYVVTWMPVREPGGFAYIPADSAFAYHLDTDNITYTNERGKILGEGTDDKGNAYKPVNSSDATSRPRLTPKVPLGLSIEFEPSEERASKAKAPEKINFWFEFYSGIPKAPDTLLRLSVSDYTFDKIY